MCTRNGEGEGVTGNRRGLQESGYRVKGTEKRVPGSGYRVVGSGWCRIACQLLSKSNVDNRRRAPITAEEVKVKIKTTGNNNNVNENSNNNNSKMKITNRETDKRQSTGDNRQLTN